jgi:hypothetical protein
MSGIAKALGAVFILIGVMAALVGVLGMITIVGIIPGFIAWALGTLSLCIGLLMGWPIETRAWLVKNKAQREARRRAMLKDVDAEVENILAHEVENILAHEG